MRAIVMSAAVLAAAAGPALADQYTDLMTFQGALASYRLVNFDVDPAGIPLGPGSDVEIGSTYGAWGLEFPRGNRSVTFFGGPVSPPRGWLNDTDVGGDKIFDFDVTGGDYTAAGVHNVLFGGIVGGSTLTAYGDGGVVLDSVTSNTIASTLDFFGVTTASPIRRVVITVNGGGGWGLDDLYVGQVIPAPSSAAALALAGLAVGRRRRA